MINFSVAPTSAIFFRELKRAVFCKTFVVVTFVIPLVLAFLLFMQLMYEQKQMIGQKQKQTKSQHNVVVASSNKVLLDDLEKAFEEGASNNSIKLSTQVLAEEDITEYLEKNKSKILQGKLSGIYLLPNSTDEYNQKLIRFYASNVNLADLHSSMSQFINQALLTAYLDTKISLRDRQYIQRNVRIEKFKVKKQETAITAEKQTKGPYVLAFFMFLSTYISILTYGGRLVGAVIEEKANRAIEIILSSMSSTEFVVGKILGLATASFIQVSIWMMPIFYIAFNSDLPTGLKLKVDITVAIYFFINYVIAALTYFGLYAGVGSMFDSITKAQPAFMVVISLLFCSMLACFIVASDPTSIISYILSMTPIASLTVMPVRMVLVDLSLWQLGITLLINLVFLMVVFINVGIVFRMSILVTGINPSLRGIVQIYRSAR